MIPVEHQNHALLAYFIQFLYYTLDRIFVVNARQKSSIRPDL